MLPPVSKPYVKCDGMQRAPSVKIFVAFCSEMPLICSSIFFGLYCCQRLHSFFISLIYPRIRDRFHRVEAAIYEQLYITFCETGGPLECTQWCRRTRSACKAILVPRLRCFVFCAHYVWMKGVM